MKSTENLHLCPFNLGKHLLVLLSVTMTISRKNRKTVNNLKD